MQSPTAILVLLLLLPLSLGAQNAPAAPARTLAITFDDLPKASFSGDPLAQDLNDWRASTWQILDHLAYFQAPVVAFVNEQKLYAPGQVDARIELLQRWIRAGAELGNHTFAHPDLTRIPPAQFQDDIARGEAVTRRLMSASGQTLRFFRYPFNHTGPTPAIRDAVRSFLAQRGYTIAPYTIENFDYGFNVLYVRARRRQDDAAARRVRDAYLDHTRRISAYMEQAARTVFGRDVPQVLLVHANDLNADALRDVLQTFQARGYRFVTLAEVLRDPAYQTPDQYVGPAGISWLHRWKLAKGMPLAMQDEPDPPQWVLDEYQAATRR